MIDSIGRVLRNKIVMVLCAKEAKKSQHKKQHTPYTMVHKTQKREEGNNEQ